MTSRPFPFPAVLPALLVAMQIFAGSFRDPTLPAEVRAADLVSRLTLDEKIAQLGNEAPPIPRFGIPAHRYWNEACHGVMVEGATVFPQMIGLSSTWDTSLVRSIADAISSEARILHRNKSAYLTFFSPTINMARDPRWGRNEETFGEDVFLAKKMAVSFIRGMQGDHPRYLKTAATAKHFTCNNTETNRTSASSMVGDRSLREYYFPVFRAAVTEGRVASVMSAYNALNGVPCTASRWLLTDVLRREWGFRGYVVSDCGAVVKISSDHRFVMTNPQAVSLACKAGCDLNCGSAYQTYLPVALLTRTLSFSESDIDTALVRVLTCRFRLGEFDPPDSVPFASISPSLLNCRDHRSLSYRAAQKSIVLLKNDGLLPLDTAGISTLAVIGPFANICALGGYSGVPTEFVTPLRGIKTVFGTSDNRKIIYAQGCSIAGPRKQLDFDKAINAALESDVAVVFVGTGSEHAREAFDLVRTELPLEQQELVQSVFLANPRTVIVLVNGNPLSIPWIRNYVPAIVEAWYGGPYQGSAIADVLFGHFNPGGRLTQTWVDRDSDLPLLDDYDVFNNRTYMYFEEKPLFPFGYGQSYTSFGYEDLSIVPPSFRDRDTVSVSVDVRNTGERPGDEVVQLYIHDRKARVKIARKLLKGFSRVTLMPGESKTVMFRIPFDEFSYWCSKTGAFVVEPGEFDIMVGSSSEDIRLTGTAVAVAAVHETNTFPRLREAGYSKKGRASYEVSFHSGQPHRIVLLRTDGRVIFSRGRTGTAVYTLPTLPRGVYLATITQGARSETTKIVAVR